MEYCCRSDLLGADCAPDVVLVRPHFEGPDDQQRRDRHARPVDGHQVIGRFRCRCQTIQSRVDRAAPLRPGRLRVAVHLPVGCALGGRHVVGAGEVGPVPGEASQDVFLDADQVPDQPLHVEAAQYRQRLEAQRDRHA